MFKKAHILIVVAFIVSAITPYASFGQIAWAGAAACASGGSATYASAANWCGGAVPTSGQIAQFNCSSGCGTAHSTLMSITGTNLTMGAIEVSATRNNDLGIRNTSAGTPSNLTLDGATVNAIANVIIRNNSPQLLAPQNGASQPLNLILGNATNNIINIDGTGGVTISSVISGVGRNLTKGGSGAGVLTLSGANTYTGTTTISAGTLTLGAAGVIADASPVVMSGGTLRTGAVGGFSETVSTLGLTANSTIALGTGVHTLTFANSSGVGWTAGRTLTITGWTGNFITGAPTAGEIAIPAGGLTTTQLSQIRFQDASGKLFRAQIVGGKLVPFVLACYDLTANGNATNGTNITGGVLASGPGTAGISFAATGATDNGFNTASLDDTKYMGFSYTQSGNFNAALNELNIGYRATATGPNKIQVRVSKNSDFSDPTTILAETAITNDGSEYNIAITGLNTKTYENQTLYFRIYPYGASASGGTFRINDGTLCAEGTTRASCTEPVTQATLPVITKMSATSLKLDWTVGSGNERIVVASTGAYNITTPDSGGVYVANTAFGSGTEINLQNDEFIVYKGAGNTVTVTGLSGETYFSVYEYNTAGGGCYNILNPARASYLLHCSPASTPKHVWINEIHYDDDDGDATQGVGIVAPTFTDMTCYSVTWYGSTTTSATQALTGNMGSVENAYGETYYVNSTAEDVDVANGGIALEWNGTCGGTRHIFEFLSWGGALAPTNGPGTDLTATDIGVTESAAGTLQRGSTSGTNSFGVFATDHPNWVEAAATKNGKTATQDFKHNIFINEIHYQNVGVDVNEGVEIAGPSGVDLSCYSIIEFDGTDWKSTTALTGTIDNECNNIGTIWKDIVLSDGVMFLVLYYNGNTCACPGGDAVVQAISTTGGAISGVVPLSKLPVVSTTITATSRLLDYLGAGISEPGTALVGTSLQLVGNNATSYEDMTWIKGAPQINMGSMDVFQDLGGCKAAGTWGDGGAANTVGDGTGCVNLTQIFADACGGDEDNDEFITMRTEGGPVDLNDLFIASPKGGGLINTVSGVGGYCGDATMLANINAEISGSGGTSQAWGMPADGIIPAGSRIIVVNGPLFDPGQYTGWDNIVGGNTFVIFPCTNYTNSQFVNETGNTRTITIGVNGSAGCLETNTYTNAWANGDGNRVNFANGTAPTFDASSGCVLLPISLVSFEAILENGSVDLFWTTATETNNHYFTIERSTDGINFETILNHDGAGNSSELLNYYLNDENPFYGVNYYRLKQTDYDGKYTYSPIKVVNNTFNKKDFEVGDIIQYEDYFEVKIFTKTNQVVAVSLINVAGKTVFSNLYSISEPEEKINISKYNLANSIYLLKLTDSNNKVITKKINLH